MLSHPGSLLGCREDLRALRRAAGFPLNQAALVVIGHNLVTGKCQVGANRAPRHPAVHPWDGESAARLPRWGRGIVNHRQPPDREAGTATGMSSGGYQDQDQDQRALRRWLGTQPGQQAQPPPGWQEPHLPYTPRQAYDQQPPGSPPDQPGPGQWQATRPDQVYRGSRTRSSLRIRRSRPLASSRASPRSRLIPVTSRLGHSRHTRRSPTASSLTRQGSRLTTSRLTSRARRMASSSGRPPGPRDWSTPGLVETRFSPDALVWVAVVFHGTAAWRNHGLIIFPLLFYRTSVQLCRPAAQPDGGLRPPCRPPAAWASPRRATRFAPRVPRAGRG